MAEYYKKIYIHSEADLPKEEGTFICLWKPDAFEEYHVLTWMTTNSLREIGLKEVEWYYQPVTEEELQNELCIYPRIKK